VEFSYELIFRILAPSLEVQEVAEAACLKAMKCNAAYQAGTKLGRKPKKYQLKMKIVT
jgi:hypothetical protein